MPNFVQMFRSTDTGAPVMSGQVGAMITLLDAILVNGYATINATSISRSGTTATMVIAANATLVTGDKITVAGWNEVDYNVAGAEITVNTTTSISYQVANSPATPGTGTGTYKKSGLGWTKPYSGTNTGAYLPQSVSGRPQFYLRVADNALTTGAAKECSALGLETMSDINSGTGKFPTTTQVALTGTEAVGGVYWNKSATADATARAWTLVGDGATFYMMVNSSTSDTAGRGLCAFGGLLSFKTSDAYNGFVSGGFTTNVATMGVSTGGLTGCVAYTAAAANTGLYLARLYSQTGGSGTAVPVSFANLTSAPMGGIVSGGIDYPHGPDGALWVVPVLCLENPAATKALRGRFPGFYTHGHTTLPMAEFETATNVAGLSGVTLIATRIYGTSGAGVFFLDKTGPWT